MIDRQILVALWVIIVLLNIIIIQNANANHEDVAQWYFYTKTHNKVVVQLCGNPGKHTRSYASGHELQYRITKDKVKTYTIYHMSCTKV